MRFGVRAEELEFQECCRALTVLDRVCHHVRMPLSCHLRASWRICLAMALDALAQPWSLAGFSTASWAAASNRKSLQAHI